MDDEFLLDEFELQYADDLDALQDFEEEKGPAVTSNKETSRVESEPRCKRSLDFVSPQDDDTDVKRRRTVSEGSNELAIDESIADMITDESETPKEISRNKSIPDWMLTNTDDSRVLWRAPANDYMYGTNSSGRRFYLRCKSDNQEPISSSSASGNLLGCSLRELRDQLIQQRQTYVDRMISHEQSSNSEVEVEDQLLVQRYAPRHYTDLLSDESVNRTLLRWLKLWDHVVFNKPLPSKETKKEPKKWNREIELELDSKNRPQQRIVLLVGNPGLGKTTLAHVLARHAGYNVLEMNASDDRSADVFRTRLESATQMQSIGGAQPKPNCLIIDEIDGAPTPAINVLLEALKDKPAKKKKKRVTQLSRPIVCICNDLYATSLRALRREALILHFPPTNSTALAKRLLQISREEQVQTDMSALLALCQRTDNDVRSCLNVLQFARPSGQLTAAHVKSVAKKDHQRGIMQSLKSLLFLPNKRRNPSLDVGSSTDDSLRARFDRSYAQACSSGEYEKMAQGLFENYLDLKYKDPAMSSTVEALEWQCFSDQLQLQVMRSQIYTLGTYLPYLSVVHHLLLASTHPIRLKYPSSQHETSQKQSRCEAVITELCSEMPADLRGRLTSRLLLLELLPHLSVMLAPPLRAVNTQLYSAREKQGLRRLVDIMLMYNLRYTQQRTEEGQYTYVLDPDIDSVIQFPVQKHRAQLSYASKQLISSQIETERMRRNEPSEPPTAVSSTTPSESEEKTNVVPNHLQQLKAKPIVESHAVKVMRDFFGRVIQVPTKQTHSSTVEASENPQEKGVGKNILATELYFQFKEGYSNAVRKPIRMSELF